MRNLLVRCLALSAAFGAALLPVCAQANPAGGTVRGGGADIAQSGTTLEVRQHTQRLVIDWDGFDISAGETTRFLQPSSSAVALNRVTSGAQASHINGNLLANGRVVIVNPNGVLFGDTARVDVNGLVASAADIGNESFMQAQDRWLFDRPGADAARVENRGAITVAAGGLAAFVAPEVVNSGVIQGRLAKISLAAGDAFGIDLHGDGLFAIEVSGPARARLLKAENSGTLSGGAVLMTAAAAGDLVDGAVNMDGHIQARGLSLHDGVITLSGGDVKVSAGATLDGGHIAMEAGERLSFHGSATAPGGFVGTSSSGAMDLRGARVATGDGIWQVESGLLHIRLGSGAGAAVPDAAEIHESTIEAQDTNIVLRARQYIGVTGDSPDDMLRLMPGRSLTLETVNAPAAAPLRGIDLTGAAEGADLLFRATGAGGISLRASIDGGMNAGIFAGGLRTDTGDILVTTGKGTAWLKGDIATGGGDVAVLAQEVRMAGRAISAAGGDILLEGSVAGLRLEGARIAADSVSLLAGGDLKLWGDSLIETAGGAVTLAGAEGISIDDTVIATRGGDVTIRAIGGRFSPLLSMNGLTVNATGGAGTGSISGEGSGYALQFRHASGNSFSEGASGGRVTFAGGKVRGENSCIRSGGAGSCVAWADPPAPPSLPLPLPPPVFDPPAAPLPPPPPSSSSSSSPVRRTPDAAALAALEPAAGGDDSCGRGNVPGGEGCGRF